MQKRPGKKTATAPTRVIRRKKLAAAVVQGVPVATAARQLGVTRSFASREINSPEGRTIIDRMVDKRSAEIEELLDLGLAAVRELVSPTYTVTLKPRKGQKKPRIVEKATDPKVRLMALKRVIEIALAGRGKDAAKGDTNTFTWQQFLSVYNSPKDGPPS